MQRVAGESADVQLPPSDPRLGLRTDAGSKLDGADCIYARGNVDILLNHRLALFCSRKCPGKLILQTYDLAQKLRNAGVTVIGGFHTPMEQECLRILLQSPYPVIICPARDLPTRIPPEWKRPLEDGRLLLLTPFSKTTSRATELTAQVRNSFVAEVAHELFVAYAEPGSRTESFCRDAVARGKRLFTLPTEENRNLHALGALAWDGAHLE